MPDTLPRSPVVPSRVTPVRVHVESSPLELETGDGLLLGATHWWPNGPSRGVVLVAPATGVPHRFYRHFASHIAGHGFEVVAWDWRGIGASRTALGHRDARLTMRAWGERDLEAAIAWADRRARGQRVALVGHSFGG